MLNTKALSVTIIKTGLAFLPIVLAPLLLREGENLISFYRLQLGFSVVAATVTLGLSSYIYLLSSDLGGSFSLRKDFWNLLTLFRVISILLTFFLLFAALISWNSFYLELALFSPISYFLIQQQISLAKGWYRKSLLVFAMPPAIFMSILLFSGALGGERYTQVCIGVLLITNLLFLSRYQMSLVIKLVRSKPIRLKFGEYIRRIFPQIINGVIVSVCAPLTSLFIIDWISAHGIASQLVAAYYFYARAVDALVGFCLAYLLASNVKNSLIKLNERRAPLLIAIGFLTLLAFMGVNYAVYRAFGFMSFSMAILEFMIGFLRFGLTLLSLIFLQTHPNLIGSKEAFVCLAIWLLSIFIYPQSILLVQLLVFIVVFIALIFFAGRVFLFKKHCASDGRI